MFENKYKSYVINKNYNVKDIHKKFNRKYTITTTRM